VRRRIERKRREVGGEQVGGGGVGVGRVERRKVREVWENEERGVVVRREDGRRLRERG